LNILTRNDIAYTILCRVISVCVDSYLTVLNERRGKNKNYDKYPQTCKIVSKHHSSDKCVIS